MTATPLGAPTKDRTGRLVYRLPGGGTYTFHPGWTEEDATRLATTILSGNGCNYEILWPHERQERHDYETMRKARADLRDTIGEKANDWIVGLELDHRLSPEVESLLHQAFLAGWRAAPLGPRAVRP